MGELLGCTCQLFLLLALPCCPLACWGACHAARRLLLASFPSHPCRWARLEGGPGMTAEDSAVHKMVMNIGRRPTFGDAGEVVFAISS